MTYVEEYLGYVIYRKADGSYTAKDRFGSYTALTYSLAELKLAIRRATA